VERVRRSLLQPDLCHRESEFFDLQDEARTRLLAVYGLDPAEWTAVLMTGSGTAAVESMMASVVPKGPRPDRGERRVRGADCARCARNTGFLMSASSARGWRRRTLPRLPRDSTRPSGEAPFTHLSVVHHETTTGRLNELRPLPICVARGTLGLLLDGVSSFGAEELDFAHGGLSAVAATANKVPAWSAGVFRS